MGHQDEKHLIVFINKINSLDLVAINPFSKFLNIYLNRATTILYFYSSSPGIAMLPWNIAECGIPLFILTAEPYTALAQLLLTAAVSAIHSCIIFRAVRYSKIVQLKYLTCTKIQDFNILLHSGFPSHEVSWAPGDASTMGGGHPQTMQPDCSGKQFLYLELSISPWIWVHCQQ